MTEETENYTLAAVEDIKARAVAEERAKNVAIIRERKQTLELRAQSFYHKHRTVGGDSLSDQALALDWVAKEIEAS